MKKIKLSFFAILALSSVSFAQSTGKVTLSKGQKMAVENKINTVISLEVQGNSAETTIDMNSNSIIEVKDQQDKNYKLTNTITRMTMNTSGMGQSMSFDSDKKEDREGEMGKDISEVINKPIDINVNESGKVVAGKDDNKDNAVKSGMAAMFGGSGDPKTFVEVAFITVPAGAKVGNSWVDSSSSEGGKKSTTYTIREIKGSDAVLDLKGTMQSTTKQEMMGMEVSTTTSGNMEGEAVVNMATGVIKSHAVTINATGTTAAMGQDIPMTTKVTSKTTVTPQ